MRMTYHYTHIRVSKTIIVIIPNGKDKEELELLYSFGRNVRWYNHFERLFS